MLDRLKAWIVEWIGLGELQASVDYLLMNALNLGIAAETGPTGNERLRALFLSIVDGVRPTVFCDIGAYDASMAAGVKARLPGCKVIAFEANPLIFQKFHDDPRLANVSYLNVAVSDRSGRGTMFMPKVLFESYVDGVLVRQTRIEPSNTGRTSLLQRNQDASYDELEVECGRLDDVLLREVGKLKQQRIVLWIDAEGAADKVLAGALQTLRSTLAIFVETENRQFWRDQKTAGEISGILMAQGFVPVARDREYGDRQFNILFLHRRILPLLYGMLFDVEARTAARRSGG